MEEIIEAIRTYIKRKNDIPVPADILAILDPEPEQLSSAYYVQLKKRATSGLYDSILSPDEEEFIWKFERQEREKAKR